MAGQVCIPRRCGSLGAVASPPIPSTPRLTRRTSPDTSKSRRLSGSTTSVTRASGSVSRRGVARKVVCALPPGILHDAVRQGECLMHLAGARSAAVAEPWRVDCAPWRTGYGRVVTVLVDRPRETKTGDRLPPPRWTCKRLDYWSKLKRFGTSAWYCEGLRNRADHLDGFPDRQWFQRRPREKRRSAYFESARAWPVGT